MARKYAEGTKTPEWKSGLEITQMLKKHGCTQVATFDDDRGNTFMFALHGLTYRITLVMPDTDKQEFKAEQGGPWGKRGTFLEAKYQAEVQRLWRSLVLVIKAKLVGVADGIETFEQSFLPYMVTGNGQTVGESIIPQMQEGAALGSIPSRLALPGVS